MTSWERSKRFYVDGLGFHVDWEHQFEPGFPVFTQLTRNGLSFFLTEHTGDCQVGGAAYFVVDDVDALYREISGRGIRPAEPPEDTPWQTREIVAQQPVRQTSRLRSCVKSETSSLGSIEVARTIILRLSISVRVSSVLNTVTVWVPGLIGHLISSR